MYQWQSYLKNRHHDFPVQHAFHLPTIILAASYYYWQIKTPMVATIYQVLTTCQAPCSQYPCEASTVIISFWQVKKTWCREVNNLSRVTQLVRDKAKIRIQVCYYSLWSSTSDTVPLPRSRNKLLCVTHYT